MFKDIKIKTFTLSDLVGREVAIRSFKDGGTTLFVAIDTKDGMMFALEENRSDKKVEGKVVGHKCTHCGFLWFPTEGDPPLQCPECKLPAEWDTLRFKKGGGWHCL